MWERKDEMRGTMTETDRRQAVSRTTATSDDGYGGCHQVRFYSDLGFGAAMVQVWFSSA
ncbi:hypothetical protein HanXRQr2_Chr13g0597531 [Helianthus annuus]|uniref:Uncharacterized protein n=2 Tax=Helianthus annuus TaxID=4232 RepID=A0A9K3EI34_HELAN|nr:hypothetical protein HanXRQr2_Chr13g0597521 [Helianthus annuus]KAF5774195.1 hypothetical protein HanXRQr2_Chr13g0597531 [Helianthus annuus]KAJ0850004.1 hypothetical protein HanPSC8_Chr13g0575571 [Helianthus annuus]KAJ0850005.1 hypothetical protein HanPSC8_Chr13g0575581 [Helianthus annuus]